MLVQVGGGLGNRPIMVAANSSFAALDFLASVSYLPNPVHVVTRLRLDPAFYKLALPRDAHTISRPCKVGQRLPTLKNRLEDSTTRWQFLTLEGWYGQQICTLEWVSQTAVWYHTGFPPIPIRWVLVPAHWASWGLRPFSVLIWRPHPPKSCCGFGNGGKSKSPSRRCGLIWGLKLSGSGVTQRSYVRLLPYWPCSRW